MGEDQERAGLLLPEPDPLTVSVIIPTCGRHTLTRTLASIAPQLADGDEMIVVRNDDAPWGHAARDEAITRAKGDYLWFMDDDDTATPDALNTIRQAVAKDPDRFHIFKMRSSTGTYWHEPVVQEGQVGTPMMVVPNVPELLGRWDGGGYSGDAHFLKTTVSKRRDQPVWHEEIVALIRPAE